MYPRRVLPVESRTPSVGKSELYKEERDGLELKMRRTDACDTEKFGTLRVGEKTATVSGDEWWPRTAKDEGDNVIEQNYVMRGRDVLSAQRLEASLIGAGTVLRLERESWPIGK